MPHVVLALEVIDMNVHRLILHGEIDNGVVSWCRSPLTTSGKEEDTRAGFLDIDQLKASNSKPIFWMRLECDQRRMGSTDGEVVWKDARLAEYSHRALQQSAATNHVADVGSGFKNCSCTI